MCVYVRECVGCCVRKNVWYEPISWQPRRGCTGQRDVPHRTERQMFKPAHGTVDESHWTRKHHLLFSLSLSTCACTSTSAHMHTCSSNPHLFLRRVVCLQKVLVVRGWVLHCTKARWPLRFCSAVIEWKNVSGRYLCACIYVHLPHTHTHTRTHSHTHTRTVTHLHSHNTCTLHSHI